ncbi:hypothetical protein M9Y10_006217 [Tritrichomonas musculus]|uniref:UBC core domain-containing protein n=1 Tax=Tritrichomonas musculus TaxID=1915356 RepID=A0ABR2JER1_9EUKA
MNLSIKINGYYPLQPPIFRLIDVPYRINVSKDVRVCSSFLHSNYSASSSIYNLVVNVRDILQRPDENYAIQKYKLNLWKTDRDQFYENAKGSC